MDYYLIAYILFSIVLITTPPFILSQQNKSIAAVLYAIGAIGVCVFYGLRWFNGDKAKSLGYDGQWPPANRINFCPDYFTMTEGKDANNNTIKVCVDNVGFSKPSTLNKYNSDSTPTLVTYDTSNNSFTYSGKNAIPLNIMTKKEDKCRICQEIGVTWEGVYDGSSCIGLGKQNVDSSNRPVTCPQT